MRFSQADAPAAMLGHLGAVSLKKSHDIIILSFCNIVKGQTNILYHFSLCRQQIFQYHRTIVSFKLLYQYM